jgi:glutathione S-transferase
MITLFDYALSGNCYKVRLLLRWLKLEYETTPIDFYPGFEHRGNAFLRINPLGQLPALQDGAETIRDAQAILVHLAANYDADGKWYPIKEPHRLGQIQVWLAFADSITSTFSAARLHDAMFFDVDIERARAGATRLIRILDEHLWFGEQEGRDWLCPGSHPTVADIACFPYTALCEEGGIYLDDFPAVQRWIGRFMRLEGFEPMPGMLALPLPKLEVRA